MSDLLELARKRLTDLRKDIEILERFVESAEAAQSVIGRQVSAAYADSNSWDKRVDGLESPAGAANEGPESPQEPVKRKRVTDNPKPKVLIPAAIEILRQHGAPMSRRQLHEALSERGLVVNGSDPIKALGTILWRAKNEIVQIEGRGYWPKNDEYAPAKYWGEFHDLM